MKHTVLAIPLLYLTAQLAYAEPAFVFGQDPKPTDMAWQRVEQLSDEFQGTALDHSKWQDKPVGNGWIWDGRPPGLFKPSNATVEDGKMRITVSRLDEPVTKNGKIFTHQGAIVRSLSVGHVGWYFECKMKANSTAMSSTFWLMTKGNTRKKLECDIQECVGRTTDRTAGWGKNWDQIFHSNAIHPSPLVSATLLPNRRRISAANSAPRLTSVSEIRPVVSGV
jgi:hypothetical protein